MIPHTIHYCWFGQAPLPPLAEECIASWKKYMPSWQIMRWDETTLSQALNQPNLNPSLKGRTSKQRSNQSQDSEGCWLDYMPTYVKQAYESRKFAFVSDYVRLWALEQYGGLYMDVDFEVFRPFDDLMDKYPAFAGVEGCKRQAVMMGVIASEPHGAWVRDMLATYESREFLKPDGSLDLTPNTSYFTDRLESQGFVADGVEKDFYLLESTKTQINTVPAINIEKGEVTKNVDCINQEKNKKNSHEDEGIFMLHVFPVHYFCPVLTTGEDVRTEETYCIHRGLGSWNTYSNWRTRLAKHFSPKWRTRLIKIKRKLFG